MVMAQCQKRVNRDAYGTISCLTAFDLDGNGIQVVKFPDDGHPTMCAAAVNLCGDTRDEIVTWDYDSM